MRRLSALSTAGAALINDGDYLRAAIAHPLAPVTGWLAYVACLVAGGHMKGTRAIFGAAMFTALASATAALKVPPRTRRGAQ